MDWPGGSRGVPSSLLQLVFQATDLRNRDVMSKSDPMLVAYGFNEQGQEEELGRSETIPNTLNPMWTFDRNIQYRFEDFLGQLKITVAEIVASPPHVLTRPLQGSPRDGRPGGTLTIRAEEVGAGFGRPEEVELLLRGSSLENMETFSKSDSFPRISILAADGVWAPVYQTEHLNQNGDPRPPSSLHYIDPTGRLNAYQTAIAAVGRVLQYYDTDKKLPCWEFGARINGSVSHCFPLYNNPGNPEVVDFSLNDYQSGVYSERENLLLCVGFMVNGMKGILAFDVGKREWRADSWVCGPLFVAEGTDLSVHFAIAQLVECSGVIYLFSEQESERDVTHCIDRLDIVSGNPGYVWTRVVTRQRQGYRALLVYPEYTCLPVGENERSFSTPLNGQEWFTICRRNLWTREDFEDDGVVFHSLNPVAYVFEPP